MSLPRDFIERPLSHRGLHDVTAGRAENSTKAFAAAIDADYGIELDVQLSSDGHAMAFHDYDLGRLTSPCFMMVTVSRLWSRSWAKLPDACPF